jgi:hypothetical protein
VVRIAKIGQGYKVFLDGSSRDPSQQVQQGSSLIVGSRHSSTAKRLLTNDSTGRLVVDVKVSSSVSEQLGGQHNRFSVLSKDRTSQSVGRGFVTEMKSFFVLISRIDVDSEDGAKDFLGHELRLGVLRNNDGGFNKVSNAVITLASSNDFVFFGVGFGNLNVALDVVEGVLVDDGRDEGGEVVALAHLHGGEDALEFCLGLRPHRVGEVGARAGAALLSLIFKRGSNSVVHDVVDISRSVDKVEVLASSFSDNAGVRAVETILQVHRGLVENVIEHASAASKVQAGKVRGVDEDVSDQSTRAGQKVDDTGRHARFFQDAEEDVVGKDSSGCGFPEDDVAHHSRGGWEIGADGGEVEGGNSDHISFL